MVLDVVVEASRREILRCVGETLGKSVGSCWMRVWSDLWCVLLGLMYASCSILSTCGQLAQRMDVMSSGQTSGALRCRASMFLYFGCDTNSCAAGTMRGCNVFRSDQRTTAVTRQHVPGCDTMLRWASLAKYDIRCRDGTVSFQHGHAHIVVRKQEQDRESVTQ